MAHRPTAINYFFLLFFFFLELLELLLLLLEVPLPELPLAVAIFVVWYI